MSALRKPAPSEDDARARLEAMCARAEHCTQELRDKLWVWGVSRDVAERILARLQDDGFVDDRRFARAYASDKVKFSRWGRRKLQVMLSRKRISSEDIAAAIEEIDEAVYEENLRHLLILKAASLTSDSEAHTHEGRVKLFRFAVSRGYEPEMCGRFIREMFP